MKKYDYLIVGAGFIWSGHGIMNFGKKGEKNVW